MAAKKHLRRRKVRSKPKGGFMRFVKTVVISATASFMVTMWIINPNLIENINIDSIAAKVDLGRLIGQTQTVFTPVSHDRYVQTSFVQCRQFFPDQIPPIVPSAPRLRELCFNPFAILHSGQTKTPVFVAQKLNRQMLIAGRYIKRTDRFYEEARLPKAERATLDDYRGSGYDRGHMAPAGDMHNDDAMAQSFSLANIVPQDAQHNRGAWSKIENDTRKYVMRANGNVYIFTGSVYEGRAATVGNRVAVPNYLYKVVYDATTERSWVHWHKNSADFKVEAPISYTEFVRRTGLYLLGAPG